MTANERQVGGDHYKTGGTELWDLFGPEAIIFYATRYLQRWRKKDGVQDLEKALHCVQKLREIAPQIKTISGPLMVADDMFELWLHNSGMNHDEQGIVRRLVIHWRNDVELDYATAGISYLIAKERSKNVQADAVTGVALQADMSRLPQNTTYSEMTDKELATELTTLQTKQSEATGWGAAVGVRGEYIAEIQKESNGRGGLYHLECQPNPKEDLAPWQIDGKTYREWSAGNAVRHAALIVFYKQVTRDIYRLEPFVKSKHIPEELQPCYVYDVRILEPSTRLLQIDRVPAILRECYPSLRPKVNEVEYDQLPEWQRAMYVPRVDGGYSLDGGNSAWHVEEEV